MVCQAETIKEYNRLLDEQEEQRAQELSARMERSAPRLEPVDDSPRIGRSRSMWLDPAAMYSVCKCRQGLKPSLGYRHKPPKIPRTGRIDEEVARECSTRLRKQGSFV